MERFLLFSFNADSPRGGWGDFKGAFETLEKAEAFNKTLKFHWYQVVDSQTGKMLRGDLFRPPVKP